MSSIWREAKKKSDIQHYVLLSLHFMNAEHFKSMFMFI